MEGASRRSVSRRTRSSFRPLPISRAIVTRSWRGPPRCAVSTWIPLRRAPFSRSNGSDSDRGRGARLPPRVLDERPLLVLLEGGAQLGAGVHDDRAVPGDRLLEGLACDQE